MLLAATLINQDMDTALHADGLTQARARALWEVAERAPVTQRQLADALEVTPRNVTTLVDALEEAGFVRRGAHAGDRRAILVELTAKGRKAVAHMATAANELADQLFGDLSAKELAVVNRVLARVAERFAG